jgi:hypothetical protein
MSFDPNIERLQPQFCCYEQDLCFDCRENKLAFEWIDELNNPTIDPQQAIKELYKD